MGYERRSGIETVWRRIERSGLPRGQPGAGSPLLKEANMATWEYKVAYVDFRGRISSEGSEFIRQSGEHRTAFVRRYLDALGQEGWEVAAVHPLLRMETSYLVLKRPGTAAEKQG